MNGLQARIKFVNRCSTVFSETPSDATSTICSSEEAGIPSSGEEYFLI
jgi:hypothetical protein